MRKRREVERLTRTGGAAVLQVAQQLLQHEGARQHHHVMHQLQRPQPQECAALRRSEVIIRSIPFAMKCVCRAQGRVILTCLSLITTGKKSHEWFVGRTLIGNVTLCVTQ